MNRLLKIQSIYLYLRLTWSHSVEFNNIVFIIMQIQLVNYMNGSTKEDDRKIVFMEKCVTLNKVIEKLKWGSLNVLCSNCNKKNQITKKLREAHLIVFCDFNTHLQIQGNKNRFPIFKIFRIFSITHFSRHLFFNSCNSFLKTNINFDRAFNKLFCTEEHDM